MKKLFAIVAGIGLILGVAANASANYTAGTFYSLLSDGTNQFSTDLDVVGETDVDADSLTAASVTTNLNLASFTGASSWSDVTLFAGAYYQYYETVTYTDYSSFPPVEVSNTYSHMNYYVAGNGLAVDSTTYAEGWGGAINLVNYNQNDVDGAVGYEEVTADTAMFQISNAYTSIFDDYLIDLGVLADGGTISMDIYTLVTADVSGDVWTLADSGFNYTLSLNDDGYIVSSISAVPVPAAVWLLGSGLLGLIGIRRRNA